jgi:hypothetical protein
VRDYVKKSKSLPRAIKAIADAEDLVSRLAGERSPGSWTGAHRAAAHLRECETLAEIMEHTFMSSRIGEALGFYLDNGMLLADVHANNVGVVTRPPDTEYDEEHNVNVVTDPGHMVPLDPKWLDVQVPQLLG